MRVKTVKRFGDKNAKMQIREIGEQFNCSPERFAELKGFVKEIKIKETINKK